MRRNVLGCVGLALAILSGCKSSEPKLKPPPHPEVLAVPPQDDSRFSKPPAYPEETLNGDPKKNKRPNSLAPEGPPTRFGGGGSPGMGGP